MQKTQKDYKIFGILISVFIVTIPTSGHTQEQGLNFIFEIKGNVEIKRNNQKFRRAFEGDILNFSDKVRLSKGASTKISCNNNSTWLLSSQGEFLVSKGCSFTTTPIFRVNRNVDPPRGLNNPNIPYLISPRNSTILSSQPTLRWNSVPGATSYQVQISSGDEFNWTTQVSQPMVVYSGNVPLKTGLYKVNITSSNGASTEGNDDAVFFIVHSDEYIRQVKFQIAQLQQQQLSESSKSLALAHLYRSYDLNADAIDLLEVLVKGGNKTTAVYQLLGSIYQQIGLNQLARESYLIALKLAKTEGNLEAQADIQGSLEQMEP